MWFTQRDCVVKTQVALCCLTVWTKKARTCRFNCSTVVTLFWLGTNWLSVVLRCKKCLKKEKAISSRSASHRLPAGVVLMEPLARFCGQLWAERERRVNPSTSGPNTCPIQTLRRHWRMCLAKCCEPPQHCRHPLLKILRT